MENVELMKNIERMEKELEEMRATLKQSREGKVWEPVRGEMTYFVNGSDYVQGYNWNESDADKKYYEMGSIYKTKKEAEKAVARRKAKVRIIKALREHEGDFEADWGKSLQKKYNIYYNHNTRLFDVGITNCVQYYDTDMYSSKGACQWVIDNMQDDLKLHFDVS